MIWRIPGISLNLHYPKEDDGELYTACPIIKGSRGIEPLNPLPQRRIRHTLPAYLCLKTALRRSEIREYYRTSELKAKNDLKGSFFDILKKTKVTNVLSLIEKNGWHIHFNAVQILYYGFVDIIDSIEGLDSEPYEFKAV